MKQTLYTWFGIAALFAASCNAPAPDTTTKEASATTEAPAERNKKIIAASMAALNSHNVDEIIKDAAADVTDYGDGQGPAIHGRDSLKMMLQSWLTAFPDYKQDNIEYVAEGNKVIAVYDATGTWKGDFMGMKPTGKSLKTRDVDIFTFNDAGKIASHRSIQNMGPVMASVGMAAPAVAAHAQAAPPEKK